MFDESRHTEFPFSLRRARDVAHPGSGSAHLCSPYLPFAACELLNSSRGTFVNGGFKLAMSLSTICSSVCTFFHDPSCGSGLYALKNEILRGAEMNESRPFFMLKAHRNDGLDGNTKMLTSYLGRSNVYDTQNRTARYIPPQHERNPWDCFAHILAQPLRPRP
jgi:hypothetical protein